MSSNAFKFPVSQNWEPETYYQELTTRNQHFIAPETQKTLSRIRILIAGCGSTGGACIESLARAGVQNFLLADNGEYELNNLNRQHAGTENIGQNKALYHAGEIRRINPFAVIETHAEGLTSENVSDLVNKADLIMDAVDVTTPSGIQMKLELHRQAHLLKKPTLTALDLGFCQWGESYDYRDPSVLLLKGRYKKAKEAKHPLKALFSFVPTSAIPAHCLPLVHDLLTKPGVSASQLGCTSDLLSSIIVAGVIRFAETQELIAGWNIDLSSLVYSPKKRISVFWRSFLLRFQIRQLLKKIT